MVLLKQRRLMGSLGRRIVASRGHAAPLSAVPQPAFLTDTVDAFYDPAQGVTLATTKVTDWTNSGAGGTSYDLAQATDAQRFVFNASDANFNGAPTMTGAATTVMATAAGSFWEIADGGDFTVAAVVRQDGTVGVQNIIGTDDMENGGFGLRPVTSATCRLRTHDGTTANAAEGDALTANTVQVLAGVFTGAASPSADNSQCFVDGSGGTALTPDLGAIAQGGTEEFLVGARLASTGANAFTGEFGQLFFYKGILTAAQDAALTRYWNFLYGINVPSVTR